MRHQGAVLRALVAIGIAVAGTPSAWAQARSAAADEPPSPPYTRDSFAFAGPVPQRVELQVEGAGPNRTGDLHLRLRNRTRLSGPLHVRYFSRGAGTIELLGDRPAGEDSPVTVIYDQGRGVDVGAHDVAGIHLRFRVRGKLPVRALDGLLVAQLRARGRFGPVARVRIRALGPVAFDPAKVHLRVQRDCVWPLKCEATTEVALRGAGARALMAESGSIGAARLEESDSDAVRVVLDRPVLRHGVVWSTLRADDFRGTGNFTGAVPLSTGDGAQQVAVEVSVRRPFWYAVIAVLIGSLLAALGARWTGVRRRASIARLEVLTALGEYDAERKAAGSDPVASFPLDRWIEPRGGKNGRVRARPGTRGVGALMWDLQKARTKEDVERDIARAQSHCSRIRRWLTVEPAARQADDLLDLSSGERACGTFDRAERYLPDLELLLSRTRSPAKNIQDLDAIDDHAAELAASVADQVELTTAASQVWALLRRLEKSEVPEEEYLRYDLVTARGRELAAEARTPEQTEALRRDLYRSRAALERVCQRHQLPTDEVESIDRPETADGRAPVLKSIPVSGKRRLAIAFSWVELKDWAWTLIRATATVIVYVQTIYDPAWGSTEQLIAAFTTGFTQETLIGWAGLPAFQALRSAVSARGGRESAPESSPDSNPLPAPAPPEARREERVRQPTAR
jgi:hypothetical protein